METVGRYTKILDIKASERRSDYAKLYKSFLRIANSTTDIDIDAACDFVRLLVKTRLAESNLSEARVVLVDKMPEEETKGMFDPNSFQIFLPDTIFQNLSSKNGRAFSREQRILNTIRDILTVIHEVDHLQYESHLQGNYALGIHKRFSKEEYSSNRLERLKNGVLKFKDKHFSSAFGIQDENFSEAFYHIKYGKYYTSRYETRARTSSLEYVNNLILNTRQFVSSHPVEGLTLSASFLTPRYNFTMNNLLTQMSKIFKDERVREDIKMSDNLFQLEPTRPIIEAITGFQYMYFKEIQERESRIAILHSKVSLNTATQEEVSEYSDMIEERDLFEDTFSLVQNDEMAHQIAFMPGINPSLKAATLLYSNASISREEVATIYRDERYYGTHPDLVFPSSSGVTPFSFTEYNQSEIKEIHSFVYSEQAPTE